jgi:hypothetical protein
MRSAGEGWADGRANCLGAFSVFEISRRNSQPSMISPEISVGGHTVSFRISACLTSLPPTPVASTIRFRL